MVIVDVVTLVFTCATFVVLYITYRRTIVFKIKEVHQRIEREDGAAKSALDKQSQRLDELATLKHQGYFAPLAYCFVVSFAGGLVTLSKGGLVPCSLGQLLARCPWPPIAAFAGAYVFTLFDLVRRHRRMEMHADAIQQAWLRMLAAPILAVVFSSMLKEELAVPIAAALGIIPAGELLSALANRGRKALGVDGSSQGAQVTDLSELQGMDKERLERFVSEGVTTIQQLAMGDTVATFVAVNVEWKTLLDYVDQAILYCFVGKEVVELRKRGIRGAIEVVELSDNLASTAQTVRNNSALLVKDLATVLNIPDVGVLNLIETIATDGQVELLRKLWEDAFEVQDEEGDADKPSALARTVDVAA